MGDKSGISGDELFVWGIIAVVVVSGVSWAAVAAGLGNFVHTFEQHLQHGDQRPRPHHRPAPPASSAQGMRTQTNFHLSDGRVARVSSPRVLG